jgi:hypothetical protein
MMQERGRKVAWHYIHSKIAPYQLFAISSDRLYASRLCPAGGRWPLVVAGLTSVHRDVHMGRASCTRRYSQLTASLTPVL